MNEKPKRWIASRSGGVIGLYSVIRQDGRIIAMHIPDPKVAFQISLLPTIRRLGEAARMHHATSGERLPKAYKDLFDILSKLVEPR